MTDVCYKVWVSKTGRKGACLLPKLKAIPLTLETLKENVKRAHFQACIWKAALDEEPPNHDPLNLNVSKMILPSPSVQFLYHRMFLLYQQNYSKRSSACAAVISFARISDGPCSLFCKCSVCDSCCNQMTKNNMANDDEEHSDEDDH